MFFYSGGKDTRHAQKIFGVGRMRSALAQLEIEFSFIANVISV